MYEMETLIKTFKQHHEKSKEIDKILIRQFQENSPGEPVPEEYTSDFSLPMALVAICQEIQNLKENQLMAQDEIVRNMITSSACEPHVLDKD